MLAGALSLAGCGGGGDGPLGTETGGPGTGGPGTGGPGTGGPGTGGPGTGGPGTGDPGTGDPAESHVGNRHFDTLGPWAKLYVQHDGHPGLASLHLSGGYGADKRPLLFLGRASRSRPSLALNPGLTGISSATWSGEVVGVTHNDPVPNEYDSPYFPVSGDVSLTLNLTDLQGDLVFTNLERWPDRTLLEGPGVTGAGTLLDGGTLHYEIYISEAESAYGQNAKPTFYRSGGDEGVINGQFVSRITSDDPHEGIAGQILRRDTNISWSGVFAGFRE